MSNERQREQARERGRRHRRRRRQGLRCIPTPVSDELVEHWQRVGLIESDDMDEIAEVAAALIEEYGLRFDG